MSRSHAEFRSVFDEFFSLRVRSQAGRYVQYALTAAFTNGFVGAEKSTDALAFWKSQTVVVNAKTHAEFGVPEIVSIASPSVTPADK